MTSIEMINNIKEWALLGLEKGQTKYKLRHDAAIFLIIHDVDVHDEFVNYLFNKDVSEYGWTDSDVEKFFEQYRIEIY